PTRSGQGRHPCREEACSPPDARDEAGSFSRASQSLWWCAIGPDLDVGERHGGISFRGFVLCPQICPQVGLDFTGSTWTIVDDYTKKNGLNFWFRPFP